MGWDLIVLTHGFVGFFKYWDDTNADIYTRKRSFPTVLPPKVIVPDAFSQFVKELIVWSLERFRARKKHPAARSIDRGTRSYVFVKVRIPKRWSCKVRSLNPKVKTPLKYKCRVSYLANLRNSLKRLKNEIIFAVFPLTHTHSNALMWQNHY